MKHASLIFACVFFAIVGGTARAGAVAEANAVAADGAARFARGDFAGALVAFQRANYLNLDEPSYYKNIGDCYRGLYNTGEAIRFYRLYLREKPNAADRESVKATIALLQREPLRLPPSPDARTGTRAETSMGTSAGTETTSLVEGAQPARRPVYKKWWFWTMLGGAVAVGVGVGLGVGLSRSSSFSPTLPPFGAGSQGLTRF
jgi:tetratricopeptide (TPR) repeat protein